MMITSTTELMARTTGKFFVTTVLLAAALLIAVPSSGDAKAKLWLYPDTDDPRAGGHVVYDNPFTLVVENRGSDDGDTATGLLLVLVVNDLDLFESVTLTWPDHDPVTVFGEDLQPGTPTQECDGKAIPRHSWFPGEFTTIPIADELAPGGMVEIEVDIIGEDGLEVHFDAMATGSKVKRGLEVCYSVVNPSGHDVTAVLGEPGGDEDDCPDVEITKSADVTWVEIDDPVTYTLEVMSSEDCDPLEGVVITEDIPTVTDGVDTFPAFWVDMDNVDPAPTSFDDVSITWELGTLDPGVPVVITVPVVFNQVLADGKNVVNTACVIADGIDDPECSRFRVAVGMVSDDDEIGGAGFWCHRISFALEGRRPATYTVDELLAFLADLDEQSTVFSEIYEIFDEGAPALDLAEMFLCLPRLADSDADRLARHLLTLWFNIVSERVDPDLTLGDLCPGDEELPEGADETLTIGAVVEGAEADMQPEAVDPDLGMWKDIVEFINNAGAPGDDGTCEDVAPSPRRMRGRRLGTRNR